MGYSGDTIWTDFQEVRPVRHTPTLRLMFHSILLERKLIDFIQIDYDIQY